MTPEEALQKLATVDMNISLIEWASLSSAILMGIPQWQPIETFENKQSYLLRHRRAPVWRIGHYSELDLGFFVDATETIEFAEDWLVYALPTPTEGEG